MRITRTLSLVAAAIITTSIQPLHADSITLAKNHPVEYVVKKGDTLWDISETFLEKPWLWPEIWHINPQIHNPHLIYPGDIISLTYVNGRPVLIKKSGGSSKNSAKAMSIPAFDLSKIPENIRDSIIATDHTTLDNEARISSIRGGRLIAGENDVVYATLRDNTKPDDIYWIYDNFKPVISAKPNKNIIAYIAEKKAESRVEQTGKVTTLKITRSIKEVLANDLVIKPSEQPHISEIHGGNNGKKYTGEIVKIIGDKYLAATDDIIILHSKDETSDIKNGLIVTINQQGNDDTNTAEAREPVATAIVFRAIDDIGLAIVTTAKEEVINGYAAQSNGSQSAIINP